MSMKVETSDLELVEPGQRSKSFEAVKKWQKTRKDLIDRADKLKGKDNQRSRELRRAADRMDTGKSMTTAQIRRAETVGRLDLLADEIKHRKK